MSGQSLKLSYIYARFNDTQHICLEFPNEAALTIFPLVTHNSNDLIFCKPNNTSFDFKAQLKPNFVSSAAALLH